MKQIFTFLTLVSSLVVFCQAPDAMSYQAVIRDASNELVASQSVGMQISILQGSASGTVVYTETQTPTTNANGLVSIAIEQEQQVMIYLVLIGQMDHISSKQKRILMVVVIIVL